MTNIQYLKRILSSGRMEREPKLLIKLLFAATSIYAAQKIIQIYLAAKKNRPDSELPPIEGGIIRIPAHAPTSAPFPAPALFKRLLRNIAVKFNGRLVKQTLGLLKILVPGVFSKEAGILFVHSTILLVRTFLTIYVASIEGGLTKSIVRLDVRKFVWNLCKFFLVAIPATFVNSMIRYYESYLGMAFRTRLVDYAYRKYFSKGTYYRVAVLDGRLANADQCLTDDISSLTSMAARLYSQLTKPLFDLLIITFTLRKYARKHHGEILKSPLAIALAAILSTFGVLRMISPKFGQLVREEAARKGYLRYVHGRLITNAEEVAFYGGHKIEHNQLIRAYESVRDHMVRIYRKRMFYVMMEQFFMKYVWTASGLTIIAIPAFMGKLRKGKITDLSDGEDDSYSERAGRLTIGKNLLGSAADAVERLMSSYKDVIELSGYVMRVSNMLDVFEDVAGGRYRRDALTPTPIQGEVIEEEGVISLQDVPIITPGGEVIVQRISLEIRPGMHLLITGPNGCGKSSLFRVLGGLWPVYRGTLRKPPASSLFYIPQRPYLSLGTLRDQLIYPDCAEDMLAKGHRDEHLQQILRLVHLSHIVEREGGWDARNDWMDVFSGGEKQRIGLARIFYHKPMFAILDECTSAVSIDVEGDIYEAAKHTGVTLLTVTHRPSLWKYHTHVLQFDGSGGWSFRTLDQNFLQQQAPGVSNQPRFSPTNKSYDLLQQIGNDECTELRD